MSFNTPQFILFFTICFSLIWFLNNRNKIKARNTAILLLSYLFYSCFDYRFTVLILISTIIDFFIGIKISLADHIKLKFRYLVLAISLNLSILFLFKYYNFFIDSIGSLFENLSIEIGLPTVSLIVPIGISFYTFQSMSYSIDIYKKRIKPSHDFIAFASYVSFFPQLLAGPIERSTQFLPQFKIKRSFDSNQLKNGLRQVLWGLFMKLAVANNCAIYVDQVFNTIEKYDSFSLIFASILFGIQIYSDFAGYSHIAIGLSLLLGFKLSQNFNYPYFSTNLPDMWRRWHMTLTQWIFNYVYYPMLVRLKKIKNSHFRSSICVIFVFLLIGLWHGANLTFIVWGLVHGLFFLLSSLKIFRFNYPKNLLAKVLFSLNTFLFVALTGVLFRSKNLTEAFSFYTSILNPKGSLNIFYSVKEKADIFLFIYILILFISEFVNRQKRHPLEDFQKPIIIRWGVYILLSIFVIDNFKSESAFIYFNF